MRRGYQPWHAYEVAAIKEWAGSVPRKEIAARLGRSEASVRNEAARLGVSLACPWRLVWCSCCSNWRTSLNAKTGYCAVCTIRAKARKAEAETAHLIARAGIASATNRVRGGSGKRKAAVQPPKPPDLAGLGKSEAAKANQRFCEEVEAWHLDRAQRDYAAARKQLQRARADFMNIPRR